MKNKEKIAAMRTLMALLLVIIYGGSVVWAFREHDPYYALVGSVSFLFLIWYQSERIIRK